MISKNHDEFVIAQNRIFIITKSFRFFDKKKIDSVISKNGISDIKKINFVISQNQIYFLISQNRVCDVIK